FDADFSVNSVGFREAVIDRLTEGVERDFAFAIPFRAADFRTAEAAGAAQLDALGAEIHRLLDGLLHRAAEADAALDLQGHVFRDELGVEFGGLDFLDVDLDRLAIGHRLDGLGHILDLGAFTTDDDAGTGGENGDADAVPGALDDDLRDG